MNSLSSLIKNNTELLALFGSLTIAYLFVRAAWTLWKGFKEFILAGPLGLGVDLKSYGPWAVVTGSTDGIGLAYAEELAKLGLNIVLISRSPEKLENVSKSIESKYRVQTKCIAVDFTALEGIYARITRELANLEIGVLVNNVGMSYEFPKFLLEVDDQEMRNVIIVNCFAATFMSKAVLPGMVERKKGVILNISSLTGTVGSPLLSVYSATKAYMRMFSACVQTEYRSKGIIIQNVAPGFVSTKMTKIRKASFMAPSPSTLARSALSTVGVANETFGCLAHGIMGFVTTRIPSPLYNRLAMKLLLGARARGLKKQSEKKE